MDRKNIENKYKVKVKQSFTIKMDAFLFMEIIEKGILDGVVDDVESRERFRKFDLNESAIADALDHAWAKSGTEKLNERPELTYKDVDDQIRDWKRENGWMGKLPTDRLGKVWLDEYRKSFEFESGTSQTSVDAFLLFYGEDSETRECSYCGITDSKVAELRRQAFIKTKCGRGRYMEIDRLNSNREYRRDNVRLACYWCNNAKTDEFAPEEFSKVAAGITDIWNERLSLASLPLIKRPSPAVRGRLSSARVLRGG